MNFTQNNNIHSDKRVKIDMFSELIKKVQSMPESKNAKEIAEDILDIIDYKSSSSSVPIVEIAKLMGFSVRLVDELPNNDSGFVIIHPELKEKLGSTKCIFISKKIKYGKNRFVLAHEIGHYLFDFNEQENVEFSHVYTLSYNKNTENDTKERRVNEFAAALLMPEKNFVAEYNKLRKNQDATLAEICLSLSEYFETTTKSVSKRMNELKDSGLVG